MNLYVRAAAVIVAAAAAAACGKRGNPLPPLRPVPARIADAAASRTATGITITFTVPAANLDGTTPPAISRVDVYAWQGAEGAATPPAGLIIAERRNLRQSLPVVPPPAEGTPAPSTTKAVNPGSAAVVLDTLPTSATPLATMAYVLVPVAGTGRGRNGPPSAPLVVPAGALPAPPTAIKLGHNETNITATWVAPVASGTPGALASPATPATPATPGTPGAVGNPGPPTGLAYQVVRTDASGTPLDASAAPAAAPGPEVSFPVEFGREVCVAVRSVVTAGRVTTAGVLSRPSCLTPVDRFPPPAPEGLRAVQEGAAVALSWNGVAAADLAGYIVLRGEGTPDNLQPLMRGPVKDTTFRDTTVRAGVTYFYTVYAEDGAAPPNISQLSNRETVTVR